MSTITQADFEFIREFVFHRSAIALETSKTYLVESRLDTLARKEGLACASEVVAKLRSNGSDRFQAKVMDIMTTNETSFFRDPLVFDALTQHMLPGRSAPLRIWSAACSSGQEPYSIALQLREQLPALVPHTSILATDLSTSMLEAAEAGRYSTLEVNRGLPAALLPRYFHKRGLKWEIKAELRSGLTFRRMNLAEPWSGVGLQDVVFLRNVLIYFDTRTKRAVLDRVKTVLKPGGTLVLGAAETTLHLDPEFRRVQMGRSSCYQLA